MPRLKKNNSPTKKKAPVKSASKTSTPCLSDSGNLIQMLSEPRPGRILENLTHLLMAEFSCPGCLIYTVPKSNSFLPELTCEGLPALFLKKFRGLKKTEIRSLLAQPGKNQSQAYVTGIAGSPEWMALYQESLPPQFRYCLTFPVPDKQGKPWAFIALFTRKRPSSGKTQQSHLDNAAQLLNLLRERQRDKRAIKSIKTQLTDEMEDQTQKMREAIRQLQDEIVQRKIMERSLKTSNEKLQNLSNHLQKVREDERTRISREIHDELGQMLTTLKMKLSILEERALEENYPIEEDIQSMMTVAETTLQTVRRISTELRPGILDVLGLSEAVEWQAQEFQNQTKINMTTDIDRISETIDREIATTFFRICQEALTNVARHARASRVMVCLKHERGNLELFVRDNGKGITNEQLTRITSLGLIGMRERAQNLGGDLVIQRAQPKGTEVRISFPLDFAS